MSVAVSDVLIMWQGGYQSVPMGQLDECDNFSTSSSDTDDTAIPLVISRYGCTRVTVRSAVSDVSDEDCCQS